MGTLRKLWTGSERKVANFILIKALYFLVCVCLGSRVSHITHLIILVSQALPRHKAMQIDKHRKD